MVVKKRLQNRPLGGPADHRGAYAGSLAGFLPFGGFSSRTGSRTGSKLDAGRIRTGLGTVFFANQVQWALADQLPDSFLSADSAPEPDPEPDPNRIQAGSKPDPSRTKTTPSRAEFPILAPILGVPE